MSNVAATPTPTGPKQVPGLTAASLSAGAARSAAISQYTSAKFRTMAYELPGGPATRRTTRVRVRHNSTTCIVNGHFTWNGGQGALTEGASSEPVLRRGEQRNPHSLRPLGEEPPPSRRMWNRKDGKKILTRRRLRSRVQPQQLTVRQLYGWEALQTGRKELGSCSLGTRQHKRPKQRHNPCAVVASQP